MFHDTTPYWSPRSDPPTVLEGGLDAGATVLPLLDQQEAAVIAIGLEDARRSGWRGSHVRRGWLRHGLAAMGSALFGYRPVQSLANERLETLRLLVCVVRRDIQGREALIERLAMLGMTQQAIAAAIAASNAAKATAPVGTKGLRATLKESVKG